MKSTNPKSPNSLTVASACSASLATPADLYARYLDLLHGFVAYHLGYVRLTRRDLQHHTATFLTLFTSVILRRHSCIVARHLAQTEEDAAAGQTQQTAKSQIRPREVLEPADGLD
jgi:hypothetical protein